MTKSIQALLGSTYFKEGRQDSEGDKSGGLKTILLLLGFIGLTASSANALTFFGPKEAEEGMPWLKIELIDLLYVVVFLDISQIK